MLFTWSSKNVCIIFPEWRITGTGSLIASLLAIILLTAAYEAVRSFTRIYEANHTQRLRAYSSTVVTGMFFPLFSHMSWVFFPPRQPIAEARTSLQDNENIQHSVDDAETGRSGGLSNFTSSLLVGRDSKQALEQRGKIVMALLYAVQVFYSFFIMLVSPQSIMLLSQS
jgi:copper transporter 1